MPKAPGVLVKAIGGTFEMRYPRGKGSKYEFRKETALRGMIDKLGAHFIQLQPHEFKDSEFMTDDDRAYLAHSCAVESKDGWKHIVVVHGTDTMVPSAGAIAEHLARDPETRDTVVVLTGASTPAMQTDTDAELNFGGALHVVQVLPPGVYIVMNGRCFDWDKCAKQDDGTFMHRVPA